MSEETAITHDPKSQQFSIALGKDDAELTYARPEEGVVDFQHTYVPTAFRGSGNGTRLIRHALDWARAENLKVIASCEAVRGFLQENPDYQALQQR